MKPDPTDKPTDKLTDKLTDGAVSNLPLAAGRAHLLEEIMSTPVLDTVTLEPPRSPQHRRWLVPVAAAATVAAVAIASAWWPGGEAAPTPAPQLSPAAPAAPAPAEQSTDGYRAVLDAPGWQVVNVEAGQTGSVAYQRGKASVEITWAPAASYAGYVTDREHIVEPPAPGEPVEVLGAAGQLWAYSATDHTVIREVRRGHWMEIRGSGMNRAAYEGLLTSLRLVDLAGFEDALPPEFVRGSQRPDSIEAMLQDIFDAAGATLPEGVKASSVRSDEQDPYHLGADVAGAVACAWLDEFAAASAAGDTARADEAARVLSTSRDWPVLQEMAQQGGYSDVVWHYADTVAAGDQPEGYRGGLGC